MFFLMYVTIPQMTSALIRSNNVKLQLQGVIMHAVYFLHLITKRKREHKPAAVGTKEKINVLCVNPLTD